MKSLAAVLILLSTMAHAGDSMFEGPLGISEQRSASGTAWQPDSTPMNAVHFMADDWMLMVHGLAFAGYDYQNTRRGGDQLFSTNWGMAMAERELAGGELELRGMLSLEPATVGRDGYPLLLQSGESLGGKPLHDVQHPHDLFMEVAADYRRALGDDVGFELYLAPAGEPALGPPGFPHRRSAMSDPVSPLGHHWEDATHVSFGVITGGLFTRWGKLEASWFNGREPDENRWDFDIRTPDSYSVRLALNPTPELSVQISGGHLKSPEKLEPDVELTRVTASLTHNFAFGDEGNVATTFVWGTNWPTGEPSTPAFLLETNVELDRHHTPFARLEYVRKTGQDLALPQSLADSQFGIATATLGYVYDFDEIASVVPGVGGAASFDVYDGGLAPFYGHTTGYGFQIFFRFSAPRM
ncbi:MAG: hypothetical protein ACHQ6T_14725 [Myxococcota bacterium]